MVGRRRDVLDTGTTQASCLLCRISLPRPTQGTPACSASSINLDARPADYETTLTLQLPRQGDHQCYGLFTKAIPLRHQRPFVNFNVGLVLQRAMITHALVNFKRLPMSR